jgi:hypothetical protein
MKRAFRVTALLAMGLLVASTFVAAQDAPASSVGGQVTLGVLGHDTVTSSKFTEYREVPQGVSIPSLNLFAWKGDTGFTLWADNVRQTDQRYAGVASLSWLGMAFDYNQTPHNMGNNAHLIWNEVSPGYWGMSASLRAALGTKADTTLPTSLRTYDFYNNLLAPTFAAAQTVDISSQRERGTVAFDLGKKLPFDLSLTYMRERKSGYRGQDGGDIVSAVGSVIDVPEPMNELTQDYGFRAGYNFKMGNVHAALSRNTYDNQAETLRVDNPFQPYDVAYNNVSASPLGGPGTAQFILAPDNEATTGSFGALFKLQKLTRIGADLQFGSWTQNAAFYPYTSNTTIRTTAGAVASSTASLQQPSLNGKYDTTTVNLWLTSKPLENFGVRARYRSYDLQNKTAKYVITGDAASSPDRSWSTVSVSADAPYGHPTANPYSTTSKRFDLSANYDIKALTLEGSYFNNSLTRTYREGEEGTDKGFGVAAVYHMNDLVGVRAFYNDAKRTVVGTTDTSGFQEDEAERTLKRTGIDVELSPLAGLGLTFQYARKNAEYPNRPLKVASDPTTISGLLWAKYDTFTVEADYAPNARAEFNAFYTYEKNDQNNRWNTLSGTALNNQLNYQSLDKGNTFGVNGVFQIVPDQWTLNVFAQSQKIDGLDDITAREAGSFYTPGRTGLIPVGAGGAADITDWDDTTLTTFTLGIDRHVKKAWTLGVGYTYEKYDFADAYTSGTTMLPASIYIMSKPDNGSYTANVGYAYLRYKF